MGLGRHHQNCCWHPIGLAACRRALQPKGKKDLHHVATAIGWPMLPVLQNVTEKQIEIEVRGECLKEELKLERDMHLLQADNKDTLGRQNRPVNDYRTQYAVLPGYGGSNQCPPIYELLWCNLTRIPASGILQAKVKVTWTQIIVDEGWGGYKGRRKDVYVSSYYVPED